MGPWSFATRRVSGLLIGLSVCMLSAGGALAQVASAPKRNAPVITNASCTTSECHTAQVGHAVQHPQDRVPCVACHLQTGEPADHKFTFVAKQEELCIKCHQLPAEAHGHAPVVKGECLQCHAPHGSNHPAQLVADPNRSLCLKCHNDEFMRKKFVHGPVAVGACMTCHKAHSSENPKLLMADANALCKTCHADTGQPGEGVHVHKALDNGCVNCHDPHASDHKFQMVAASPQLCLSCHGEQFKQMTAGNAVVHGAITQEGGCTSCHEPHASRLPGLQRAREPETCLKCHSEPIKDDAGRPLTNMAQLLAINPDKHGPIRDGHCTVCHDPHAGPKFRLLPAEYPEQFYAKYSDDLYQLCFQCHTPELASNENGLGVTQFRDGTRNLHALHVNQEKGRTCRACHEVHASKRASHIRESVPFGTSNWMLEINFQPSEQGGSCAPGCHAEKTYTRPTATLPAPKDRPAPPTTSATPAPDLKSAPPAATPESAASEPARPPAIAAPPAGKAQP